MKPQTPALRVDLAPNGRLFLAQPRYSARTQKLILSLPERTWTGKGWEVPVSLLPKIRTEFYSVQLIEAPEVQAMRTAVPKRASGPAIDAKISDYDFKTQPFAHQREGFALARRKRTFAFLMEMGTGKTKTSIDVVSYHLKRGALDFVLIICPLAVVWNWEREIEVHSPLAPERKRVAVLAGTAAEKLKALRAGIATGATFFVTNYETLVHCTEVFDELFAQFERRKGALGLDESTKIKNPNSKAFKRCYKMGLLAQARYILTGSPITQSPLDAFAQFKFLDWKILGHSSFTSFKHEYAIFLQKGPLRGRKVIEWKNLDRLRAKIEPFSFRVLKSECLDLPEKVYRTIELPMGAKQFRAYEEMREHAVASLDGAEVVAPIVLTRMLRLSQIAAGYFPIVNETGETVDVKWFPDEPKIAATVDLVEEAIEEGQKVIVWCRGLPEIRSLSEKLAPFGVVTYSGNVPGRERQAHVDAFQGDAKTRVFIGQIQTGGMAITLTAATNVIYYSNSYSLADRLQSEDRAHRIGQKASVTYTDLVCRNSIDKLVIRTLRAKKSLADVVTGDNLKQLLMEG